MKLIPIMTGLILGIFLGMGLLFILLLYTVVRDDFLQIGNTVFYKDDEPPTKDEWRMM